MFLADQPGGTGAAAVLKTLGAPKAEDTFLDWGDSLIERVSIVLCVHIILIHSFENLRIWAFCRYIDRK